VSTAQPDRGPSGVYVGEVAEGLPTSTRSAHLGKVSRENCGPRATGVAVRDPLSGPSVQFVSANRQHRASRRICRNTRLEIGGFGEVARTEVGRCPGQGTATRKHDCEAAKRPTFRPGVLHLIQASWASSTSTVYSDLLSFLALYVISACNDHLRSRYFACTEDTVCRPAGRHADSLDLDREHAR